MSETKKIELFVVRHYASDEAPCIKGNGFDGLTVGETRKDAQEFVDWVNDRLKEWDALLKLLSDSFWMIESYEAGDKDKIVDRARALLGEKK